MRALLIAVLCLALAGCEARGGSVRGDVVHWPDGAPPDLSRPPDKKRPADKPQPPPDKPRDWWNPPDKPKPPDLPPPPDMGKPDLPPPPVCKDSYEPNNNCSVSRYLGSSTQGAAWVTKGAITLDPGSDLDWFSAKGVEKNHSCFPGTSQNYKFKVRVQVPAGRNFKVCVYKESCAGSGACSTGAGPTQVEVSYKVKGICALNDDTEARILVQNMTSKGGCPPYSVSFYYAD